MNKSHTVLPKSIVYGVGGLIIGALVTYFLVSERESKNQTRVKAKVPLYWVAPMDADYRRDKPGKSPMGMDLIPVYGDEISKKSTEPGAITIAPHVVNNLGVRTGVAVRKALHSEIVTVGYVQYDENKLVHIHPRVSGWVEKLFVKASGDPVKKGAPLYSLYSPELVNAQEELILALNRDNKRLLEASEDRLEAIGISDAFIKELRGSRRIKQTVNFYAPQSGVVDNLNIREGFFVQPGTTMLSIGALDQVWVEAEIFERQTSLVKVNDPVTMTLGYLPGRKWFGKIEFIYPTLDPDTRTVRIRVTFDNPDRALKPNMFAQITVASDSEEQLLMIPREALIRTGNQDRVVIALGQGTFKSVAVVVGRVNQNMAEIIQGIEEGETVVTSAQFLLDSESSKTSDFKRMTPVMDVSQLSEAAWVKGEVLNVHPDDGKVTVSHDSIEAWGMPAMTMDFPLHSSVDIHRLRPGILMHMQVSREQNGTLEISGIRILSAGSDENKIRGNDSSLEAIHAAEHERLNDPNARSGGD